ncbi:hypothetical protein GCM10022393_05730 [Aquimarina addita]|uniref:YARHG domain-containing protein n=1 Tax=Aquimarina addita TaxID=870485 RepID=A0ABP7XAA8_9FLAO
MKNIIVLLFCALLVCCKKEVKTEPIAATPVETKDEVNEVITETKVEETIDQTNMLGYYVGLFIAEDYGDIYEKKGSFSNKINIAIDRVTQDSLYGHSVVAGNSRPFKGIFNSESLHAKVSEPGDDKYDGVFEFTILPEDKKLTGVWIANNTNLAVPRRKYELNKKAYKYDTTLNLSPEYDFNIPLSNTQFGESLELESVDPEKISKLNASAQQLTNQDVENLNKGELEIIRNMIYARHGYSFKNRKMRYFFDSEIDWYVPISTDIRSKLTATEKKNIDLIKRYEEHAERYYDYFGR